MFEIIMQLHGGSGGGGTQVKQSAPGSSAAATISSATDGQRQALREQLLNRKNRASNNYVGSAIQKALKIGQTGE